MQLPRRICGSMVALGLAGAMGALGCSRSVTESVASSEADLQSFPTMETPTFTTVFKAPLVIEGLAADRAGNLYTAGRQGNPCPVWRVPSGGGTEVVVGTLPPPCSPNGLAFDAAGDLFVADGSTETNGTTGDKIYRLTPNASTPPTATLFASGVPGANGIAFDRKGNLWATDGTTGQGRIWSITPQGVVNEEFRIPPLANLVSTIATTTDAGVTTLTGGVGRDVRALPPGTLVITDSTRVAGNTAGTVPIVANGIAFDLEGNVLVADTARGAIWEVAFDRKSGGLLSPVGCDTTFTPDTLCLKDILVQHALLEGLDGIVLDVAGNIWGAANERNALVLVTRGGRVNEFVRNPPDPTSQLRNGGPLEFPTSPFLSGRKLCVTQSDTARRDNFPNKAGEVGPPAPLLAKISCLDQSVLVPGLPLPVP
jgi:sugar lactone lactonase YvrE